LDHYTYVTVLVNIHRALARGVDVPGWKFDGGHVVRNNGVNTPIAGVVTVVDDKLFIPVLNKPLALENLEWCSTSNVDEKGVDPNEMSTSAVAGSVLENNGRDCFVTVTLASTCKGRILPPQIILRGSSISFELANNASSSGLAITATENACQTKLTFPKEIERICILLKTSKEEPAILLLDGHVSRESREICSILDKYFVYGIFLPSHTSTWTQPNDLGINKEFQKLHKQNNLFMTVNRSGKGESLDYYDKVLAIISTCLFMMQKE